MCWNVRICLEDVNFILKLYGCWVRRTVYEYEKLAGGVVNKWINKMNMGCVNLAFLFFIFRLLCSCVLWQ